MFSWHFSEKGKQTEDSNQPSASDEASDDFASNDDNKENTDFRVIRKSHKRHVGPHDNGGLQRTISTGRKRKHQFEFIHMKACLQEHWHLHFN